MIRLTHDLWSRYKAAFIARDLVVEPMAWIMTKPGRNSRYNQGNVNFRNAAYVMYMVVHKSGSGFYCNHILRSGILPDNTHPPTSTVVENVPITPNGEKLKKTGKKKSLWRPQENSHTELVVAVGTYCPPEDILMDFCCGTAVSALAGLRLGVKLCIMNDRDGNKPNNSNHSSLLKPL